MMQINESAENYLEAILLLSKSGEPVRSIDIAHYLGFSKPSVSNAVKRLRENGYIEVADNGYLNLTASGQKIAAEIFERHEVITLYLMSIGVDRQTAREDACRIEHVISPTSFQKIREHMLAEHHTITDN